MGTEHSIANTNRDDILHFAKEYITPSDAFLVAAGDIEPDKLRKLLDANLSTWTGSKRQSVNVGNANLMSSRKVGLIHREGAVQSALRVGHVGISRNNPDFVPLSVLNVLLGGYFNSPHQSQSPVKFTDIPMARGVRSMHEWPQGRLWSRPKCERK